MKKILRKFFKVLVWCLFSIILLLIILVILIQVPAVQDLIRKKVVAYLEKTIHTKVEIGKLDIGFPNSIELRNIYFEDQSKDTLLACEQLVVDIAMLKLISNHVDVKNIGITGLFANVKRVSPDTVFNFDYIIRAFASTDTVVTEPTEKSSLKFTTGDIVLNNIRLNYADDVTGYYINFKLNKLNTTLKAFDPFKSVYDIPQIQLSGITTNIKQSSPKIILHETVVVVDSVESAPLTLALKNIGLKNIDINYANDSSKMQAALNLDTLGILVDKMDMSKTDLQIQKVELNNTKISLAFGKIKKTPVSNVTDKTADIDTIKNEDSWKVQLASLALANNSFRYDDSNYAKTKSGLDYHHVLVDTLNIDLSGLLLSPSGYAGKLNLLAFNEQSGLKIKNMQTEFKYADDEAFAKDLILRTKNSKLDASVLARYSSFNELANSPGKVLTDASVDTCELAVKELLMIAPALNSYLHKHRNDVLNFRGKVKGALGDINIQGASLSGFGNTALSLNGNIKGMPDAATGVYNIDLTNFVTTKKDILSFIPDSTIPSGIRIPEKITATGNYKGTINSFASKINIKTSNGDAEINSTVNLKARQYDINAVLTNINAGYILSQDSLLGNISLSAAAKGKGFDYKTMNAAINADISNAEIMQHVYSNLLMDAKIDEGNAIVNSSIDNPDVRYHLSAEVNVIEKYPSVQLKLQLDTLNLHSLNLYDDTLTLKTNISADFPVTNPDSLTGSMLLDQLQLYINGKVLKADSTSLIAQNANGIQSLRLHSNFINADWTGKYKLTEVPTAVQHTINKFYKIEGLKDSVVAPQQWQMDITVNPAAKNVSIFLPELKGSDTLHAALNYNSANDKIYLNVIAPYLSYSGQEIKMLRLNAASAEDRLNYSLTAENAASKSLILYQPSLAGYVKDNKITTNISLKDQKGDDLYHLAGTLKQIPAGVNISLDPDSLLLNRTKWQLSTDNFIEYDSAGLQVNHFFISKGDESLLINSTSPQHNAPLETTFKDFTIKTLTEFTGNDSLKVDGLLNGTFTVKDLKQNPLFTSDLKIENLKYLDDTIGNILAQVSNLDEKTLQNNITISGYDNDIVLSGKYFINDQRFDQQLSINNIDLHTLVNFSQGQLKEAGGSLKGQVDINGKSDKPAISGNIYFDSAYIISSVLGEKLRLNDERVMLDNQGIHFNKFTMTDSAGNKAILDGSILSSEDRNLKFQLDLNANDFRLINATKADNQDFYGKLNIDAAVKLRGDIQTPDINARLRINKQTDFTVLLPDSDPEIQDREGVVHFITADSSVIIETDTVPQFKMLAGLKLVTDIETDTSAMFTVVIDQRNGDALKIKGRADLAAAVDEGGNVVFTGSYEVQQGSYQLTLSLLKRKFDIQNGSTITWSGDPMDASININAVYDIKVPTIDLMEADLSGQTDEVKNKYKERLPVKVWLKMQGELLKPDISFDITIPEDLQTKWDDVENKLKLLRANDAEMSKQVFALLLLSRFVQEDPMASSAGGTTEGLVRESVSRLLSDQLNNLAGSLVRGVDLNVELTSTEDYSSGSRQNQTDLSIGVSKSLLNDRLRVNVGSNFLLEGANSNQATSNIAGDIAVDYALSEDGRYRIRAYRKNEYEGTVEGQIVESGLTFIITVNYNQFKELFQKNKTTGKNGRK